MVKNLVVIALGSNLGDRFKNLSTALAELKNKIEITACSSVYESKALLPTDADAGWDLDFYNCVICGDTNLNKEELLKFCNKIENKIAKDFKRQKNNWSPRYLDVDIISYNDEVYKSEKLQIPHSKMLERSFVMEPLAEILPNWVHPVSKKKASEYKFEDKMKKLNLKL